ncbi:MAG: hypothetical protein DDT25_01068 [Chloroflexi bacterium]|nr:hypothetical protein [Chloroflexota bacterium]
MSRSHNSVNRSVRMPAVATLALYDYFNIVRRCTNRAITQRNLPCRILNCANVQAKHGVHLWVAEHSRLDHRQRSPGTFLRRLEDKLHVAREVFDLAEELCHSKEYGSMSVMPTGVH